MNCGKHYQGTIVFRLMRMTWNDTASLCMIIIQVTPVMCTRRRAILYLLRSVGVLHSVVVYPLTTDDVVKIVNISRKYRMPIVPYSGGTSLEGHNRGVRPTIFHASLSLKTATSMHRAEYVLTCLEWIVSSRCTASISILWFVSTTNFQPVPI